MKHTYIFKVYFDILAESGETFLGLTVEPIEIGKIILTKDTKMTENQVKNAQNKITQFYNNKFNLSTCSVELKNIIV